MKKLTFCNLPEKENRYLTAKQTQLKILIKQKKK